MIMSILANLARAQKAYRQKPLCTSTADLVAEYDAVRRAYAAAMAGNNVEGALLWSDRANNIAREMARMQDFLAETGDESSSYEQQSA